jgi:hypothetical protein
MDGRVRAIWVLDRIERPSPKAGTSETILAATDEADVTMRQPGKARRRAVAEHRTPDL